MKLLEKLRLKVLCQCVFPQDLGNEMLAINIEESNRPEFDL